MFVFVFVNLGIFFSLAFWPQRAQAAPDLMTVASVSSSSVVSPTISLGVNHTCLLKEDGQLLCWGGNENGQLGDGSTTNRSRPVQVTNMITGVTAVAAGWFHTCAVKEGALYCWGEGWYGQLGIGGSTAESAPDQNLPQLVTGMDSGVTAVAAGKHHTCAVQNGAAKCWGSNLAARLGIGSSTGAFATPQQVSGLTSGVRSLTAGRDHTCALMTDGTLRCWGSSFYGQLGRGNFTNSDTPVTVLASAGVTLTNVTTVVASSGNTCAVAGASNTGYCWGNYWNGKLGNNTSGSGGATYPQVVHRFSGDSSPLTGVIGLAAGRDRTNEVDNDHHCALLNTGEVRCWGSNQYRKTGNNTTTSNWLRPITYGSTGPSLPAVAVGAGGDHTCVILADGGVQCVGRGDYGQMGVGNFNEVNNAPQWVQFPVTFTGKAWKDDNRDGIEDAGEIGRSGAKVEIFQVGNSSPLANVNTAANGLYTVTTHITQTAQLSLKVTPPVDFEVGPYQRGSDPTRDSDFYPWDGTTEPISAQIGQIYRDLGISLTPPATIIGDRVWFDENGNGIQEGNETGIPGVEVQLLQNNSVIMTTTTDAHGLYLFRDEELQGNVVVRVITSTVIPSVDGSDTEATFDLDGDKNSESPRTVVKGEYVGDIDFGYRFTTTATACSIRGTVYEDLDGSGTNSDEPGYENALITAILVSGDTVTGATSGGGRYLLKIPCDVGIVRLELTIPDGYVVSPFGRSVHFVQPGRRTIVDFPLGNPEACYPLLGCSYFDMSAASGNSFRSITLSPLSAVTNPARPFQNGAKPGQFQFSHGAYAPRTTVAIQNDTGPVGGMAWHPATKTLFSAAFAKNVASTSSGVAHFGPSGPGGIYATSLSGAATTTRFYTVTNVTPSPLTWHWSQVGKVGLGDVELSEDGSTLYTVNLYAHELVAVPISGNPPTAGSATTTSLPQPANCEASATHPFALAVKGDKLFIGMVCGGEGSNPRFAYVYQYDGARFELALGFPLDYERARSGSNLWGRNGIYYADINHQSRDWDDYPWGSTPNLSDAVDPFPGPVAKFMPWLIDIAFDGSDMVLGFRSRLGDMVTYAEWTTGGEILRACANDPDSPTAWKLENNGVCNGRTSINPPPTHDPYIPARDNVRSISQGPGGYEFYWGDDGYEGEMTFGSLAQLDGAPFMVTTQVDTMGHFGQSGVASISHETARTPGAANLPVRSFGKANALGDLEIICDGWPVTVGDRVWLDLDGDGVQDPDEKPIAGVKVELVTSGGSVIASTFTDGNGYYEFASGFTQLGTAPVAARFAARGRVSNISRLQAGESYTVRIDTRQRPVVDYAVTIAEQGEDWHNSDAIAQTISGIPYAVISFTVEADYPVDKSYDFGFKPASSLGDRVWFDINQNGIQDVGEKGVAGVLVNLLDSNGVFIRSTHTDQLGNYFFGGLSDGSYIIEFASPAPWVFSPHNEGLNDALDSDADPITGRTGVIVLPLQITDRSWDAGIHLPPGVEPASIGDRVWFDTNQNGIQDGDETGVAAIEVRLLDGSGTPLAATRTDSNGFYLFDNLAPGDYQIEFAPPDPYIITTQDAGDDGLDSDADPVTGRAIVTTLESGEHDRTWDLGIYLPPGIDPVSVGDFVWFDANQDGIQNEGEAGVGGVTVYLLAEDQSLLSEAVTTSTGYYRFRNLLPNQYAVQFVLPAGYVFTAQNAAGSAVFDVDSDADRVTGFTRLIDLRPFSDPDVDMSEFDPNSTMLPDVDDPTWDVGIYLEGAEPASLGNRVWLDLNRNGIQDLDESGVVSVTVTLLRSDGSFVDVLTTDASGFYTFTNLAPGDYLLQFTLPDGYVFTLPKQGGDDTADSDVAPVTGLTTVITLTSGQVDLTWDAGIHEDLPVVSLGNYVWEDVNGDGIQDANELGMANVTVTLKQPGGTVITTTTDAGGYYTFTLLALNQTYTVTFGLPTGYLFTVLNQGDDATDSDAPPTGVATVNLGSVDDFTLDAGLIRPASLGDRVWLDTDGDGLQDPGETGIPGVPVVLYDAVTSQPVLTTTTNASGAYSFTNLAPGSYFVQFTPPATYEVSPLDANGNLSDTTDSDVDPVSFRTTTTVLTAGENDPTWDMGLYTPASLGDRVWFDTDADGIQDVGETGIQSVTVVLYDAVTNQPVLTTTTDANGNYLFQGLAPGDYYVGVTPPAGYSASPGNVGSDDGKDSDLNPVTLLMPVTTLVAGENDPTWDAGLYTPASLGDRVWLDSDRDGIQDVGETGVPSVTAVLYDTVTNQPVLTTTTDASGAYSFTNLTPGSYYVQFTAPDGYEISPQDAGGATGNDQATGGTNDSDVNPLTGRTLPTTLTAGENDPTWDLGLYAPMSLGNQVWIDLNGNGVIDSGEQGVAGVSVILYADTNSNGILDGGDVPISTTTTSAGGYYTFTNLAAGTYLVQLPASNFADGGALFDYTATLTTTVSTDDDVDNNNDGVLQGSLGMVSGPVTLSPFAEPVTDGDSDPNTNWTVDFGVLPLASIGDRVWFDYDADGIQDTAEITGVTGIQVVLYDVNGSAVATTTTDATGYYSFTGLVSGTYSVGFTVPTGYGLSPLDANGNLSDTLDSDADPVTFRTAPTQLVWGENDPTWDAGIYFTAALGDRVWFDLNGDGQQDGGEPGVVSVTVQLLQNGVVVSTTTTDASGFYEFTGLTPGVPYSVTFVAPAGYAVSPQNQGGEATDSDASPITGSTADIVLGFGERRNDIDAGLYLPAGLGDLVWFDDNASGIQDSNEITGVTGVTVTLYQNGQVISTTTTNSSGNYSFTGLVPGVYTVSFDLPAGYGISPQDALSNGADGTDSDVNPVTLATAPITLVAGAYDPTWDAGIYPLASLGDYVWIDRDGDGAQDAGEAPLPGVVVALLAPDGSVILTTTDANGAYLFAGLEPGAYAVQFTASQGYTYTVQGGDLNSGTDSNAAPSTGKTAYVTLAAGAHNPTIDAGFAPLLVNLGNQVWYDGDNDGVLDVGEPGISGVTVALYRDSNGDGVYTPGVDAYVGMTNTVAGGYYTFTALAEGAYVVVITGTNFAPGGALAGYASSTPTASSVNNNIEGDDNGVTYGVLAGGGYVASTAVTLTVGAEPAATIQAGDSSGRWTSASTRRPAWGTMCGWMRMGTGCRT